MFSWVLKLALVALSVAVSVHAQQATPTQPAPATSAAQPVRIAVIEGLSGPLGNAGEAVFRNLVWAVERVNARGGLQFELRRYDSKGQTEEALGALRAAIDDGVRFVMQGNSSSVAAALIDAIDKHNERDPKRRVLFLNYSAVDPILTNEKCSFWHFRFDAHADMRMAALMRVLQEDRAVQSVYLIGQDYSFGQAVLREARRQLGAQRPDIRIVGEELHPIGRVKDFLPYAQKIKAKTAEVRGASAVITGNWGNDLTLLIKAAREAGYEGKFYTFYGNALGAPAAIGAAGVGQVVAVADWLPNVPGAQSEAFYRAFRERFPRPEDDYVHMRMQLMVEALAQAIQKAVNPSDVTTVARALEQADVTLSGQRGRMRAADHQFQQSLVVGVMARQARDGGQEGVKFDVEGSGYGFRVIRQLKAEQAELPTSCQMTRP